MDSEASTADKDGAAHVVTSSRKKQKAEMEKRKCEKAPKRIHKAEREKQKRDNVNTLFSDLAKVLEPSGHDYGKACMLRETIRLVGELISQVDSLKKENTALTSESHYMSIEKDELKEEKHALEAHIESLQAEIDEKMHSQNTNIHYCHQAPDITSLPDDNLTSSTAAVLVVPLLNDNSGVEREEAAHNLPSNLSRPRPRYPSSTDSWPSHVLNRLPGTTDNS
ncbi:unnamed protein product [Cuscuta epithymum]|uniref:BHLH domain-containing protein n=2 Tax=Cuscuta epithymum TaxID=186058 RepID=A0AAV0ECB6_9ASTE|nr:unnamed protein product [Cuscuta epithymum]